jgi:outer membrane protein assembly factor BamE (lipoprotein component of BamABCDE complex)
MPCRSKRNGSAAHIETSGSCSTAEEIANRCMNRQKSLLVRWTFLLLLSAVVCLSGCDKTASPVSKLSRANFDQIHDKMSKEEVKAILGSPSSTSTEDKLIYKRTTWRYIEGDKYINITFKNDELDSKDTNLGTQ